MFGAGQFVDDFMFMRGIDNASTTRPKISFLKRKNNYFKVPCISFPLTDVAPPNVCCSSVNPILCKNRGIGSFFGSRLGEKSCKKREKEEGKELPKCRLSVSTYGTKGVLSVEHTSAVTESSTLNRASHDERTAIANPTFFLSSSRKKRLLIFVQ